MTLEHLAADFPDWAGTASELIRGSVRSLLDLQRVVQQSLASEFHGVRENASGAALASLLGLAFVFGGVHAVTPGHGKSIVASYFLGRAAHPGRGLVMSLKLIGTHVLSAILLVLVISFLLDTRLGPRPADFPVVRLVSYGGVAIIGGYLLLHAVRHRTQPAGRTESLPERHGPLPYFAGLSPCPLTTIIMVTALANGMVALGLMVSLSMALGMTATVASLAVSMILGRRWLVELLAAHGAGIERMAATLQILGAAAVMTVGLTLFLGELA